MKKSPEEMSTRSLIHSLHRNRYNLSQQRYISFDQSKNIIARYNEVFKELHKRGHCYIVENGAEELRKTIHYKIPLKEETLKTLPPTKQDVLTLYFGLKGTAYCECKICEMLNLTPYDLERILWSGIERLRRPHRVAFNDNPISMD